MTGVIKRPGTEPTLSFRIYVYAFLGFEAAITAPLAIAFIAEYQFGLAPCALCWYQRYVYFALLLGIAPALFLPRFMPHLTAALYYLLGAGFLLGAGLAFFHVGVEQKWWQGLSECSANWGTDLSPEALMAALQSQPLVRCDEIPWSFAGISIAGFNALYSLIMAGAAFMFAHWLQKRTAGLGA